MSRHYHPGCPLCEHDARELGPIQGCEPPPQPGHRLERWSMTKEEWAGET